MYENPPPQRFVLRRMGAVIQAAERGVCLLTPGKVLVICTVIQTVVAILALLVAVL